MRKFLKLLLATVGVVVALAGAGLGWLVLRKPAQRPAPNEVVERTPARVARGEYLVKALCDCEGCHSDHDFTLFGWPVKPGTELQGGFAFDEKYGVPGVVQAQNLTPDPETGKGSWTDGELIRAIREGVSRDGTAIFPMMPYESYHAMSDEDVRSIVAYLRTAKPVHHAIAPSVIRFPVNLLIKGTPRPLDGPVPTPDDARDHLAYGKYLVTLGGCGDCHTPHDAHQQPIPGKEFSGGWEMIGPWGRVVTANLTPHPDTFIGKATREAFIARFKQYASLTTPPPVQPGRGTVMNWLGLSHLTEKDLGAIYDYLKHLEPIANQVNSFPDAL
jgi:mono/diheme cytochrome c family protein